MSNMQAYDKYSGYIQLTNQQQDLVNKIHDWFYNSSEQVFQFSGAAGTGKSTVIQAAIKAIGLQANEVAPMSYIGAAAIIMRTKGLWNARTIHSWLYEPFYKDGEYDAYMNRPKKILSFKRKPLPDEIRLVVVDEAGAVPIKLKPEIEGEGRKVLACGDVHQLPPVGNPNPAYLRTGKIEYLTQIMRQASGSSIPYFANDLLHGLRPRHGMYGKNVAVLYDNEIDNNLPLIANQDVILAPSNNTRNEFNDGIRKYILGYESKFPYHGERLVCRKNNWNIEVDGIGLANGLIGKVANYPSVQGFDGKTFSIDFHPNLINCTFRDVRVNYEFFMTRDQKIKKEIRDNPYSEGENFEYAYALTVHCAQGSQYDHGIYIQESLPNTRDENLNYTAVTRFSNYCIYVIPARRYY